MENNLSDLSVPTEFKDCIDKRRKNIFKISKNNKVVLITLFTEDDSEQVDIVYKENETMKDGNSFYNFNLDRINRELEDLLSKYMK